jgi:hypothetical protein
LVQQQRREAAARLQRLIHRYRAADASSEQTDSGGSGRIGADPVDASAELDAAVAAVSGDDYLRWWRALGIAEPRRAPGTDTCYAAPTDGDGTVADAEAVGAAIGAFTANRACATMRTAAWPVAKERRNAAVADLRWLAMRTVRALWYASAGTRVAVNGGKAASDGSYDPRSADRNAPLNAHDYKDDEETSAGEDENNEANELAIAEALQGHDGVGVAAALTVWMAMAGAALVICGSLLLLRLQLVVAATAAHALKEEPHERCVSDSVADDGCSGHNARLTRSDHCSTAHGS